MQINRAKYPTFFMGQRGCYRSHRHGMGESSDLHQALYAAAVTSHNFVEKNVGDQRLSALLCPISVIMCAHCAIPCMKTLSPSWVRWHFELGTAAM